MGFCQVKRNTITKNTIMYKQVNIVVFLTASLWLGCKSQPQSTKQETHHKKPNILILHVDDLGYYDLSVTGSNIYQTPNIDQLSTESVTFSNAYANYPRCVPSRYAMLTAGYPVQNGNVPDDGFEMNNLKDELNPIKQIQNEGYQTAYFGKFHLGDKQTIRHLGFQTSVAAGKAGSPISYHYPFNVKKGKGGKTKKIPIPDLDEMAKEGDYLNDVLTDQVIKYIKNRDKSKPFLIMNAFYAVHQPLEAKKEDIARNKKEIKTHDFGNQPEYIKEGTGRTKMRQDNAVYAAMVENMDENVGRMLQTLKDLGLEDNTIVIFSSDHGGLSNDGTKRRNLATSNFPLRAGKGHLYEGGIKIPFFVKWKHHFKSHTEKESIVMLMDVFPTLLDITTGKQLQTDGKSFLPILNEKENWKNRTVFWHSSKARPVNTGDSKSSAIRQGNYKLIDFYEQNRIELYNLANDRSETKNIATKNPLKTKDLLEKLNTWKSNF